MARAIVQHKTRVIDIDLRSYFDNVRHDRLLAKVARRHQSQPVDRVVKLINPVLRGWVNYFAVGHASECFGFVKDWVEKKTRRHMLRARNRQGFGWARWSRGWLYQTLKLFNGYQVVRRAPKAAPTG